MSAHEETMHDRAFYDRTPPSDAVTLDDVEQVVF
jgi:hypothetical protein